MRRRMGLPCVTGLSRDICPDHFLVSNLPELVNWADRLRRLDPEDFYRLYCAGLPAAVNPFP